MVGKWSSERFRNVRHSNIVCKVKMSLQAPVQDSWNGELFGYVVTWRELGRFDDEVEDEWARAGRLTSPGWSSAELTLAGLRSATRYAVAVRAYNRAGAGPASPMVYATSADGGKGNLCFLII